MDLYVLVFIDQLLPAKPCAKFLTCISTFNLRNSPRGSQSYYSYFVIEELGAELAMLTFPRSQSGGSIHVHLRRSQAFSLHSALSLSVIFFFFYYSAHRPKEIPIGSIY